MYTCVWTYIVELGLGFARKLNRGQYLFFRRRAAMVKGTSTKDRAGKAATQPVRKEGKKGGDSCPTKAEDPAGMWKTAQQTWCLHGLRKLGAPLDTWFAKSFHCM